MFNYLAIIQILAAGYIIFLAISGKSGVFTSPYIKKGMEERYKKYGRIGCAIAGVFVLALGIINIYSSAAYISGAIGDAELETLNTVGTVFFVLSLTALLAVYIMFRTMQDKSKRKSPVQSSAPRAAFYFDDEETNEKKDKPKGRKK